MSGLLMLLALLVLSTFLEVTFLASRVSRLEKAVRRMARVLDKPRKELADLEAEAEFISDLGEHGAPSDEDLKRLQIIEEKIARRKPQGS
jgi:hypothetical protein